MDTKINESNYWSILVRKSKKHLTIPYIIGAKCIMISDAKLDSIEELFERIINSDSEIIYSLYYCDTIGSYVMRGDNGYGMDGFLEIKNQQTGDVNLVLTTSIKVLGKSLNEVVSELSQPSESFSDKT